MALLAYVDGRIAPLGQATVPLADEGLLRGDGCFEVVRVFSGQPFALDEHLARMKRSAAALRLPMAGVDEAFDALCPGFDGLVRVLITRGPPPRVFGLQEHLRPMTSTMRLWSTEAPWLAPLGSAPLAGAKTLSYAHHMAARREAEAAGYDDALLLSRDGLVLEGPTWSLFWVEGDVVHTPPLSLGILDSITRKVAMSLMEMVETAAPLARLYEADEVIVGSTARDMIGAARLDDHDWPTAPGPVTKTLGDLLRAHVAASAP